MHVNLAYTECIHFMPNTMCWGNGNLFFQYKIIALLLSSLFKTEAQTGSKYLFAFVLFVDASMLKISAHEQQTNEETIEPAQRGLSRV